MVQSIPGVGSTTPVQAPLPIGQAEMARKVEFLQQADSFFSDKSIKAQMARFLTRMPLTPMAFAYQTSDRATIWDQLFPPTQTILMMHPRIKPKQDEEENQEGSHSSEQDDQQDNQQEDEHQQDHPANEIPIDIFSDDLIIGDDVIIGGDTLIGGDTPIETVAPIESTTIEDNDEAAAEFEIVFKHLIGQAIPADRFHALEQAYEKHQIQELDMQWVDEKNNHFLSLLHQNDPRAAGYIEQELHWQGLFRRVAAKGAVAMFQLKMDDNYLYLPNGTMVPLRATTWYSPDDSRAKLYQVHRLPNGRWMKVLEERTNQVFDWEDRKQFRRTVEDIAQRLEAEGMVRIPDSPTVMQHNPFAGTPPMAADTPATPVANRKPDSFLVR